MTEQKNKGQKQQNMEREAAVLFFFLALTFTLISGMFIGLISHYTEHGWNPGVGACAKAYSIGVGGLIIVIAITMSSLCIKQFNQARKPQTEENE